MIDLLVLAYCGSTNTERSILFHERSLPHDGARYRHPFIGSSSLSVARLSG